MSNLNLVAKKADNILLIYSAIPIKKSEACLCFLYVKSCQMLLRCLTNINHV